MAGKRFFSKSESDKDLPEDIRKRPRTLKSIVGDVVMVNSLQNMFSSLEPLLRRVVSEEVDEAMRRCTRSLVRSSSLRIQALQPSNLKLVFFKPLQVPIFTGSKIQDVDGNALRIQVVDKSCNSTPFILAHPIKLEIVVLDGDFPSSNDDETWTSTQFEKALVKERAGKRPLLHGELAVTLRDGSAVIGDIEFTDNSSWIRSRRFRIGARAVSTSSNSQGFSIAEAMTESFTVKDHRGELYKKHHPPKLEDDVWRLEKIGKDGAFHKKLSEVGIRTVQDFLKLSVIDVSKLRKTLGVGMSDKMWEVTLKHAMTCEMGNKRYIYRENNLCLTLSPICQAIEAEINGQIIQDMHNHKSFFERWLREAYGKWNSLEVVDTIMNATPLLTQGDLIEQPYHNHNHPHIGEKGMMAVAYAPGNIQMDGFDWMQVNTPYFYSAETINRNTISESSSASDLASQGL